MQLEIAIKNTEGQALGTNLLGIDQVAPGVSVRPAEVCDYPQVFGFRQKRFGADVRGTRYQQKLRALNETITKKLGVTAITGR